MYSFGFNQLLVNVVVIILKWYLSYPVASECSCDHRDVFIWFEMILQLCSGWIMQLWPLGIWDTLIWFRAISKPGTSEYSRGHEVLEFDFKWHRSDGVSDVILFQMTANVQFQLNRVVIMEIYWFGYCNITITFMILQPFTS